MVGVKFDLESLFFWVFSLAILFIVVRTAKLKRWGRLLAEPFHEYQLLKVPQFNDDYQNNQLYRRVFLYLNSLQSLEDSNLANLYAGSTKPTEIALSLNPNQSVDDDFLGARLRWTHHVVSGNGGGDTRAFLLRLRKRDKRRILRPYLLHIHSVSDGIDQSVPTEVRLFINTDRIGGGRGESERWWRSVPFTHPAPIDTVAMDADVKGKVKADLESFLKSKNYYHRLGRAWRRSYLLYGPSGTGKSSFVAAMAKFLRYDVYDVDLSKVTGDSDLKLLLLQTTNRSVIMIEDFDRYIAGKCTMGSLSVSGVLNFMDGVANSCCDERIMVFTMTTKEGIDPALLRPGRVDVHIHFPLCDFNSFKGLASNYLGLRDHKLFPQVEEMFQSGAALSPAEIGELMMVNRNPPSRALKSVITALQKTRDGRAATANRSGCSRRGGGGAAALEARRISVDSSGSVAGGRQDSAKESRKFYGLLRRKSATRSDSFDLGT